MYWLRLGAVVPVWFCISSILQYQSQFGTNWLNRCIVPCLRHSADTSLWGRLSLRQAGSSFQAVMHEHSPQGLFRRRPLKLVGLVEHRERRSAGSPSSHSRFLPGFSMNMFMEKPGRNRGRLGKGWKGQSPPLHGRSRRNTSRTSSIHVNVKLWAPLPSWWSVVPKALGNQLNNLMCEHVKNGKRVLPLDSSVRPGETWSWTRRYPKRYKP